MVSSTLLIKHLPTIFNDKDKEDFLKYFGAKEVKCITSQVNKYNIAFARFENEDIAENVLHRLHQINILGSCLSVEYAKNKEINESNQTENLISTINKEEKDNEKLYQQFMDKLNSWHSGINFKQPVPCHLRYQYPPPNTQVLINIIKVLMSVPKFYTQVLHLMNKMNLPCPFERDILPDIELDFHPAFKEKNVETMETEEVEDFKTTSESELSSSDESKGVKEIIPEKHKVKKKSKIKLNKLFKNLPVNTQKSKKTTYEEVFEKVNDSKESKKIKLSSLTLTTERIAPPEQSNEVQSSDIVSGFGYIHPIKKVEEKEVVKDIRDEREEERLEKEEIDCISEKELTENRISEKDRSILPVFKNYAEGAPTCRLYIKNLAKTVTDSDLRYIYSRYRPQSSICEPNMFDIRLMQEGRMKGQAFVTLQTVDLAQKALKETNGYILKDKPLVVQFARSSTK